MRSRGVVPAKSITAWTSLAFNCRMTRSGPRTRICVCGMDSELISRSAGDMLKDDRGADGNFGRLLVAGDDEPQARSQQQRQDLRAEVVHHVTLEEADHELRLRGDRNRTCAEAKIPTAGSRGPRRTHRRWFARWNVGRDAGAMRRRSSLPRRSRNCSTVRSRSIAASDREADSSGFFGTDDGDGVGFLGDADAGAMARAQLRGKKRIHRKRQETSRCGDAIFLHDDGAVMQRSARAEDRG